MYKNYWTTNEYTSSRHFHSNHIISGLVAQWLKAWSYTELKIQILWLLISKILATECSSEKFFKMNFSEIGEKSYW